MKIYTHRRNTPHGPPDMKSEFPKCLSAARLAIPVSQDILAWSVGCTPAAVGNYEIGFRLPTLYLASRIARALGMRHELRHFRTYGRPSLPDKRRDRRPDNPGTHGYYPRDLIRRGTATKAGAKRCAETFAGLAVARANTIGYPLDPLDHIIEDADLLPRVASAMFHTYPSGLTLTDAANVADALGMTTTLESLADAEITPIRPLPEDFHR